MGDNNISALYNFVSALVCLSITVLTRVLVPVSSDIEMKLFHEMVRRTQFQKKKFIVYYYCVLTFNVYIPNSKEK